MTKVILTSDRGTFTDYGGVSVLGYIACMPNNIVPKFLMNHIFDPPEKYSGAEPPEVPYPLRKLEASLVKNAITDLKIVAPEKLENEIDEDTKVVGINVHDPYGLSPVTFKLTMLFGGQMSWTAKYFEELENKIIQLKDKYHFKVIIGGPAAWQIGLKKPAWVDTIFNGEGELDFPVIVKKALNNEDLPEDVYGRMPKAEEIPAIIKKARFGGIQVTRGCPRGCSFCSVTPETYRTIPIETIKKEASLYLNDGVKDIEFLTDDILLYGQQKLKVNYDALNNLFSTIKNMGARYLTFPHISAPAVLSSPETVQKISELGNLKDYGAEAPVVGLETGSTKIMHKYMNAKPFPWKPEDWQKVILDATPIMNENYIFPCYTMTIGYTDETEDDLNQSIELVNTIIANELTAWVFPLPVIPMTSSRIAKNPFPYMERLPSKYWDLLYVAWKYNFKTTRKIIPNMVKRMNPITKGIVNLMTNTVFTNLDKIFLQLSETHGQKSKDFTKVNMNSVAGVMKTIYWLSKYGIRSKFSRKNKSTINKTTGA
jgi:radical SAM superfamily enzyme YgiQ (UPF0313 family)